RGPRRAGGGVSAGPRPSAPGARAAVPVIVRACNDARFIEHTLAGVRSQTVPAHLVVFDNDSDDGTSEVARRLADDVVRVPRGTYVPGRVLNEAMVRTRGPIAVFLNADCTPEHDTWLEELLLAVEPEGVAAAFSRQLPRAGCRTLEALDIERCYGDGRRPGRSRHTFSMAASAVRRRAWESFPFNGELGYSEDVHWTWRARQRGYAVRYAASSRVFHSHNYTWHELYRRYRGEGEAETDIFEWNRWRRSLLRYSVLPWGRRVLGDWCHLVPRGQLRTALESPIYRGVQAAGRRRGFMAGRIERGAEVGVSTGSRR
ncbi:MAG: glycosyltransferase family A protein, partial [Acidobacteriota bacterium]